MYLCSQKQYKKNNIICAEMKIKLIMNKILICPYFVYFKDSINHLKYFKFPFSNKSNKLSISSTLSLNLSIIISLVISL